MLTLRECAIRKINHGSFNVHAELKKTPAWPVSLKISLIRAKVTNRALAKCKMGSSRKLSGKGGHYVIFFEVVVKGKKQYKKNRKRLRIAR